MRCAHSIHYVISSWIYFESNTVSGSQVLVFVLGSIESFLIIEIPNPRVLPTVPQSKELPRRRIRHAQKLRVESHEIFEMDNRHLAQLGTIFQALDAENLKAMAPACDERPVLTIFYPEIDNRYLIWVNVLIDKPRIPLNLLTIKPINMNRGLFCLRKHKSLSGIHSQGYPILIIIRWAKIVGFPTGDMTL